MAGELCHFAHVLPTPQVTRSTGTTVKSELNANKDGTFKLDPEVAAKTPCRHFRSDRGCKMGEQCMFNHAAAISSPSRQGHDGVGNEGVEIEVLDEDSGDDVRGKSDALVPVEVSDEVEQAIRTGSGDLDVITQQLKAVAIPRPTPKSGRGERRADVPKDVGDSEFEALNAALTGQADEDDEVEVAHTPIEVSLAKVSRIRNSCTLTSLRASTTGSITARSDRR